MCLMEANRILLQRKYARIVEYISEKLNISREEAMKMFYSSVTYQMLSEGVADLHCHGDAYIGDEILLEKFQEEERKKGLLNRMMAYQKAFERLRNIE